MSAPDPYAPQYGPPPGWPQQDPSRGGPAPGTNGLAIASLVLAFVFAPAGLVTGIIARRQIRRTGEQGDGLALAGIIVSAVALVITLITIIGVIALFVGAATSGPAVPG